MLQLSNNIYFWISRRKGAYFLCILTTDLLFRNNHASHYSVGVSVATMGSNTTRLMHVCGAIACGVDSRWQGRWKRGIWKKKAKKKNSSFETNHPHLRGCVMGVCTVRGREDIRVKGKRKKRERVTGFFLLAYETRHRPEATCSHGAEGRKRIYLYTYFQTKIYCVNNMATGWVGGEEGVREKRVGRG